MTKSEQVCKCTDESVFLNVSTVISNTVLTGLSGDL